MAQHDYVIANDTHANVRSDLNNALSSIVGINSGSSAPSTTFGNMLYANTSTTPNKYYVRNNANSAWATLFTDTGLLCTADGSVSAPAIGFNSTRTHGFYYGSSTSWSAATAGVNAFTSSTTLFSFNAAANDIDFAVGATGLGANSLFVQGSDGFVGIGTGTPGTILNIVRDNNLTIRLSTALAGGTSAVTIDGRRSKGTHATPTALSSGDDILNIRSQPYHSTGTPGFVTSGSLLFESDAAESGDTVPTAFSIWTMASGGALTQRFRVTSGGYVGVGRTPDTSGLLLQVANSDTTAYGIGNYYSAADGFGSFWMSYKSRGTVASPSAISASDTLRAIVDYGYSNSAYQQAFTLYSVAEVVSSSIVQVRQSMSNQNHLGALVNRQHSGCYKSLSNNTTTTVLSMTAATLLAAGCTIRYGVEVVDGTNIQMESGIVTVAVVNKGGVFTTDIDKGTSSQAASSGTLTVTWTVTSANPALIQINSNSSLTPTGTRLVYEVFNTCGQDITVS